MIKLSSTEIQVLSYIKNNSNRGSILSLLDYLSHNYNVIINPDYKVTIKKDEFGTIHYGCSIQVQLILNKLKSLNLIKIDKTTQRLIYNSD